MITAANGKQMKALEVFSAAINFLKEHLIKNLNNRNAGNRISSETVRWVLTVPAIWNDAAKQFMREAAEKVVVVFLQILKKMFCYIMMICFFFNYRLLDY